GVPGGSRVAHARSTRRRACRDCGGRRRRRRDGLRGRRTPADQCTRGLPGGGRGSPGRVKAVVWHGDEDLRVENVDDPRIEEPSDAIVRITSTAICGSDLHLYGAKVIGMKEGDILGHEPMGVIEEVGSAVSDFAPGDRVVVPFNIACGRCYMCEQGLQSQCETTQNTETKKGASLYGYTHL